MLVFIGKSFGAENNAQNNTQNSVENKPEVCTYGSDDLFFTNAYRNMTCAHSVDNIEILSDSKDAFLQKLESLLGYKPSLSIIDDQNPYVDLDFSRAPQLDAIYISTLLFRNDFSGQLIARILKFHASRGTRINIIETGYMNSKKAKALLNELKEFSPNIQIQKYKFHTTNFFKKFNIITNILRNMHVKLWVTLSKSHPENNVVILGGRNVHDGFLFTSKPDLSKFPELDQWGPKDSFTYWQDIEFKIISPELAQAVYRQLTLFWNRNPKNMKIEAVAVRDPNGPKSPKSPEIDLGQIQIRQIISVPFNDKHALEKLYVEMFDSAKKSITISSPYLRPTKPILAALKRAIVRGIEVTIQTRINLHGDTMSGLYEESNKAAINDLYKNVKVYEWKDDSILHSKITLIDDDLSFIGSVNLSRRSFIQDIENGMLVKSTRFNADLKKMMATYQDKSELITVKQRRNYFVSFVLFLFQNQL